METRVFLCMMAVTAGFACACMAAQLGLGWARKAQAAAVSRDGKGSVGGLVARRLRNGYGIALPASRALLRMDFVAKTAADAVSALEARRVASTPEALVSACLVASMAAGLLVGALAGPIAAATTVLCLWVVAVAAVRNTRDKRQDAVREAIPDALASMSVCFGSGFTLLQTFRQVAEDVQGPLGRTFERSANMLEMGSSASSALDQLRSGSDASELAFVAVALDVQHQSGGAMGQVLDAATDAVKGELALRRSLRVQTAQAKLSARVVSVMPFILMAAFSVASPDFLAPFFSSPYGYALLALALVMQAAGIVLVRRALSVEGVS